MTDRLTGGHRTTTSMQDTIRWVNAAGESIPAYGVVQFRSNYASNFSQAAKPNNTSGLFYVNGGAPVVTSKYGESQVWSRPQLVLIDGSPTVGDEVGPVADQWYMSSEGTGYRVMHQAVGGVGAVVPVGGGGGGTHRIYFEVVDYLCVSATEVTLYVNAIYYTGGCTATIPGEDSYGEIAVSDPCGKALHFAALTLPGRTGFATYMWPRTGYCTAEWLLDDLCGNDTCVSVTP